MPTRRKALIIAMLLGCTMLAHAVEPVATTVPAMPLGSHVIAMRAEQPLLSGKGWLSPTELGLASFHLDGAAELAVDLAEHKLAPGHYRVGGILRTGTRWSGPTNHVSMYRFACIDADGNRRDLGTPKRLLGEPYAPRRASGIEGSWANWFGTLSCATVLDVHGDERLVITNTEGHGGVMTLWLQPVSGIAAASLQMSTSAVSNTFIAGQEPTVTITVTLPKNVATTNGVVVVSRRDLLMDTSEQHVVAVHLAAGETQTIEQVFPPDAGVFRVTAALGATVDDPSAVMDEGVLYACAPARVARDLPNNWPLGTHVASDIPPQPGFHWYRYFAGWHRINPAPGEFHWEEFDRVVAMVRAVGGKLLIADDGVPLWAVQRGKAGMPWAAEATAYPPDDWESLATYLCTMIARYEDDAGTIAALELCNEANTAERWLGSPTQLVDMADVFRAAAATAKHPISVIGIAVSAGDQRNYVNDLVDAGILGHIDAVSGHWYEELMSFEIETPINSLPRHVDLLATPMQQAGKILPLINSECGIEFVPRDGDRLVPQNELNRIAEADPHFDPKHPWLHGDYWRPVSERRAASTYVSSIAMLMGLGVERSFTFSILDFNVDGAPSLPWVALACFGGQLEGISFNEVSALSARVLGSDDGDGQPRALAYEFGAKDGQRLIVAWSFLSDHSIGRSKHWQPWLEPQTIAIDAIDAEISTMSSSDLYGRSHPVLTRGNDGSLRVDVGEEPVFIRLP